MKHGINRGKGVKEKTPKRFLQGGGTRIRNSSLSRILRALCFVIIGVTVIGRLIAGVHWFTDILGGILISVTLLSLYEEVISHGK